jgi:hypothetical protein
VLLIATVLVAKRFVAVAFPNTAFSALRFVVEAVTAAKRVAVALVAATLIEKRLDEVAFVITDEVAKTF